MNEPQEIPEYFLVFEDKAPYEVIPIESGSRLPIMKKFSKLRLINRYIKVLPFNMTFDEHVYQVVDVSIDRNKKTIELELIQFIAD